jgi:hypothetical protein
VDTVLFAGGFKGNCSKCGKYGHKCAEGRSTKDVAAVAQGYNPHTKPTGGLYCIYCKKPGHTKDRCFKLQNKKAGGGNYRPGGGPNRPGLGGHESAEVVLTVVECFASWFVYGESSTRADSTIFPLSKLVDFSTGRI